MSFINEQVRWCGGRECKAANILQAYDVTERKYSCKVNGKTNEHVQQK